MTARGYDGDIPQNYDRGLGPAIFQPYAEDTARRAAALRPGDVLEIAAGSGVVTRELRDRLPATAKLTALDISADMLTVARAKFRADETVSFETADACALPYADAAFDAIVCQFGFMFFPDKAKAMREAWRTLRPSGRYFLSVWDSEEHNPWARICLEITRGFFPADPPEWMKAPFSCAAIDPIRRGLDAAGFESAEISVLPCAREFDALAFARGLIFGSPVVGEIRERGGVDPETVTAAYAEALLREVGRTLPMRAILFEARKPSR